MSCQHRYRKRNFHKNLFNIHFYSCKNEDFQLKSFDIFSSFFFLLKTKIEAVLASAHNLCCSAKIRNKYTYVPMCTPVYFINVGLRG